MTRLKPQSIFFFLAFLSLLVASCNSDKLTSTLPADCDVIVTYDNQIKAIIDNSCAYSGCHDGNGGGNPPGDFQTYAGLQSFLSDTEFRRYVIDLKDDALLGMPPSYAPLGRPQDLSAEELDLVECWISSEYPEK